MLIDKFPDQYSFFLDDRELATRIKIEGFAVIILTHKIENSSVFANIHLLNSHL